MSLREDQVVLYFMEQMATQQEVTQIDHMVYSTFEGFRFWRKKKEIRKLSVPRGLMSHVPSNRSVRYFYLFINNLNNNC